MNHCVICGKPFKPSRYNLTHQKVCTPTKHRCRTPMYKDKHGVFRKKPCGCCREQYRKGSWNEDRISHRKILTPEELQKFLGAAKRKREELYWGFRLCVNAMLRIGELCLIKPEHFHIVSGRYFLEVPTLKQRRKGGDPPLLDVMIDKGTYEGVLAFAKKHEIKAKKPIFIKAKRTYQHWAKLLLQRLKFKKAGTSHFLRHTGISTRARAVRNMTDLEALRQAARHKNVKVTMKYIHSLPEEQDRLWSRVEWAK